MLVHNIRMVGFIFYFRPSLLHQRLFDLREEVSIRGLPLHLLLLVAQGVGLFVSNPAFVQNLLYTGHSLATLQVDESVSHPKRSATGTYRFILLLELVCSMVQAQSSAFAPLRCQKVTFSKN